MASSGLLHKDRHGVSLIEILVVIAIVSILLALAIPQLAKARAEARRLQSTINLKQLYVAMTGYASDESGCFPAAYSDTLYPWGPHLKISFPYWQVNRTWPGVIHDYLPMHENPRTYTSPGSSQWGDLQRVGTSYQYSTSFVGRPELWSGRLASAGSEMEVAQRIDSVGIPPGRPSCGIQNPALAGPCPMLASQT